MKIFLTIFITILVIIIFGLILNYKSYDGKSSDEDINNNKKAIKNESKKE